MAVPRTIAAASAIVVLLDIFAISGLSCRGLAPQRADDRGPVVPWQQMGMGTDDAKR